jgi:putative ABC transport system permease protein
MTAALIAISILVAVYGLLAVIAWRRPLLARLAFREASRRPLQSLLMVAGMMFGTAAILGMQGVGDTIQRGTDTQIYQSWGRIDLTVTDHGRPFSRDVADALAADPHVAAGASAVQAGFDQVGSVADLDQLLSASPVQVVGFDPGQNALGTFQLTDGTSTDGRALGPGEVLLSASAAARLEAKAGDALRISVDRAGRAVTLDVRVAGMSKWEGAGGFGKQPSVFVPLGTIQAALESPAINVVRISAKGEGLQEVQAAHSLAASVRAVLAAQPSAAGLEVREVKADDVAYNEAQGRNNRPALVVLSLLVVIAASTVVINLSLALAEERRPRLAVLRALGLTRSGMVTASMMEGALYSLAAGLLGILPGLGYTYWVDSRRVPGAEFLGPNGDALSFFTISPISIAISVCLGVTITLGTILVASIRASRLSVSSAVRDLPDPAAPTGRSWFRHAWAPVLAVLGAVAFTSANPALRLLGGAALIVAASGLARRWLGSRARASLAAAALLAWSFGSVFASQSSTFGGGMTLLIASLVLAVFATAILLATNLRLLEPALRLLSSTLAATIRPPLAYMTRRPVRTGLATSSFALVLAALALFAVLFGVLQPTVESITGGYDIRVSALGGRPLELPESLRGQVAQQESLPTWVYVGSINQELGGGASTGWHQNVSQLYALGDEQLARAPFRLQTREFRYLSDAAVWQALREDPTVAVGTGNPSNTFTFKGRHGDVRLHVIATMPRAVAPTGATFANGLLASERAFADLPTLGQGDTVLIKLRPGADARAFARQLRRSTFGQGIEVVAMADLVDQVQAANAWWVGLFTLLLQAAVVVGVLSLGILALRAVIERRRAIGVLRALGYRPGQVLAGLLIEAALTASVGILAGVGVGLITGLLYMHVFGTTAGSIEVPLIIVPAALVFAAVLLVTVWPAVRASRLTPVEALRLVG